MKPYHMFTNRLFSTLLDAPRAPRYRLYLWTILAVLVLVAMAKVLQYQESMRTDDSGATDPTVPTVVETADPAIYRLTQLMQETAVVTPQDATRLQQVMAEVRVPTDQDTERLRDLYPAN